MPRLSPCGFRIQTEHLEGVTVLDISLSFMAPAGSVHEPAAPLWRSLANFLSTSWTWLRRRCSSRNRSARCLGGLAFRRFAPRGALEDIIWWLTLIEQS